MWEWEETALSLDNSSGSSLRGIRGGYWTGSSSVLSSTWSDTTFPEDKNFNHLGFRVVRLSVPEPGSMALLLAGALVFGYRRLRK